MSRKRVPWDGPDPRPGDYLETRSQAVWLLVAVQPLRRVDVSGARLVLDLAAAARDALPEGAVVHPWSRAAPHEPEGPQRVRQTAPEGLHAVMRASWRDPEDMNRSARRAREIGGWRTFCPLRRMAARPNSQITDRHIVAADHLRLLADTAIYGLSAARDGALPIGATAYGPRSGPSAAAAAQAWSAHGLARVLQQFKPEQQWMLVHVVLLNRTIASWCAGGLNPQVEMGRLVGTLDQLERYYVSEIDRTLATEQVVRAA